jgi:hypothetical protein
MKKLSLSKILGLALGCAALVLGGIYASADSRHSNVFSAIAGTTYVLTPIPDTTPQQYSHTVDGVVRVASLGDCTVHFDLVVTLTDSPTSLVTGTQIITTGDGKSTLISKVNGYVTPDPANATFLDIHYDLSFTDGTGEFAHAQGHTLLEGFAAAAPSPGSEDFPGLTGVYPVNADLIDPNSVLGQSGDITGKATWMMQGHLDY